MVQGIDCETYVGYSLNELKRDRLRGRVLLNDIVNCHFSHLAGKRHDLDEQIKSNDVCYFVLHDLMFLDNLVPNIDHLNGYLQITKRLKEKVRKENCLEGDLKIKEKIGERLAWVKGRISYLERSNFSQEVVGLCKSGHHGNSGTLY